ncbi:MAG: urea transport system permease protein [Chloroflexota bacterium]|nr:urea transport system permease protein [Chloroflexota bacterium]
MIANYFLGRRGTTLGAVVGFAFLAALPLFLDDFHVSLLAKFLCFAIVAVSLDLIWGYAGILSIGHGVYFGLGAYAFGMYLKLEAAAGKLPDFMAWSGLTALPWFWHPFAQPAIALLMVLVVPMAVGALLGFLTFRSGIMGVYFSIVTQALALILSLLLVGQQPYFGGTNGLTNFSTIFGYSLADPNTQFNLYYVALAALVLAFVVCVLLTRSRFGLLLVALRDDPRRVRAFGYNPALINVLVFTISAGLAGLAGALFAPIVGIVSPAMIGVVPSIEMVIWVAVGGRGSLIGPIIGALVVNGAKSGFSESFPLFWQYFLGALFIGSVLFFPNGVYGAFRWVGARWRASRRDSMRGPAAAPAAESLAARLQRGQFRP